MLTQRRTNSDPGSFVNDGWSVKGMIRYLTASRSYQMASTPSPAAAVTLVMNR